MRKNSFLILFVLTLFTSTLLHADIYMKQKQTSPSVNIGGASQAGGTEIQEIWMSEKCFRLDGAKQSMLFLIDKNKSYAVNHQNKTYMEIPMDFGNEAASKELDKEGMEQYQKMMKNMTNISVSVTPTNEHKKIGSWNCQKYIQVMDTFMGKITSEIWATQDINFDYDMYTKFSATMMAQMPGMKENMQGLISEMKKIKGIQVYTKMTMDLMGTAQTTVTELIEAKNKSVPAEKLTLPSGYKKQTF